MVKNISCNSEKASYDIFFVRAGNGDISLHTAATA